jgi:sigma-E factor negative regulatory protein RseC
MAEREAEVIEIITTPASETPGLVRLAFEVNSGCGRCHETGGCGGINLAQPLCSKPKSLLVPDPLGLRLHERVLVAVPDVMISRGATRAYLIPLLLLFAGSLIGAFVLPIATPITWQLTSDVGAIAGAGIGLVLAWWQLQRVQQSGLIPVPRIVQRLS